MPNVAIYNISGAKVGEMELSENIFGQELNVPAMHAYVKAYLANQRQGTQSVKTRAEVSGGGKKPWRQKGTGRARQGSTRSPQWTHGGVVFAPKPRCYRYTVNRKVRRLAMKSAFTSKAQADEIIVLDKLALDAPKTREMVKVLRALGATKKALVLVAEKDEQLLRASRNIPGVTIALINTLNVYEILRHDAFILTQDAVRQVEEVYA